MSCPMTPLPRPRPIYTRQTPYITSSVNDARRAPRDLHTIHAIMSSTKVSHNQPNYSYAEIRKFVISITNSSALSKNQIESRKQSSVINCISKA